MARRGEADQALDDDDAAMQSRYADGLTIRPLRNGEVGTVAAVFARLGPAARVRRFCGAKSRLSDRELESLSRVDAAHHVLVGFVGGDPEPVAVARLVRDGASAEIAFEVADAYQGRGIGRALASALAADARAAGIRELTATVCGDNPPAVSLLRSIGRSLRTSRRDWEAQFVVGLRQ